jgi:Calcineurin-like phosphoesterase
MRIFALLFLYSSIATAQTDKNIAKWFQNKTKLKVVETNTPKTLNGPEALPILLVSDTQVNNLFAGPSVLRTPIADKKIPAAMKPVAQDYHELDLFRNMLRMDGKGKFIIHLGDVANIGCIIEWQNFKQALFEEIKGTRGFVAAAGNHEFFYLGNYQAGATFVDGNPNVAAWNKMCWDLETLDENTVANIKENTRYIQTKKTYFQNYINTINEENKIFPNFPILNFNNCEKMGEAKKKYLLEPNSDWEACSYNYLKNGPPNSFIESIFFGKNNSPKFQVSYKDFMVQKVNLKGPETNLPFPVKGIILDSNDYEAAPSFFQAVTNPGGKDRPVSTSFNAGMNGSINAVQWEKVLEMIGEESPETVFIFFAHHQFDSWSELSKKKFYEILKTVNKGVLITGHTHTGYIKDQGAFVEINLGSNLDKNIQSGSLAIVKEGESSWHLNFNRRFLNAQTYNCSGIPDFTNEKKWNYLTYREASLIDEWNTVNRTLDTVLITLRRYFEFQKFKNPNVDELIKIGDEPEVCGDNNLKKSQECRMKKIRLIKILENNDYLQTKNNPTYLKQKLHYGTCQAIFASEAKYKLRHTEHP